MICFQFQQSSKNKTTHTASTIGLRDIDDTTMVKERVSPGMAKHMEREKEKVRRVAESGSHYGADNLPALIADLEAQMREAATNLDFETAARLRDELFEVKAKAGRESSRGGSLASLHGR